MVLHKLEKVCVSLFLNELVVGKEQETELGVY